MKTIIFALAATLTSALAQDKVVKLWPNEVPGEKEAKADHVILIRKKGGIARISKVTDPSYTVYLPEKTTGTTPAVVILPGGGYSILAHEHEGSMVAEILKKNGIAAFVLHYRVPRKKEGALQDAQRCMSMVRSKAKEYNIDPQKLGIMGFSAGGNLTARVCSHYKTQSYPKQDAHDDASSKPNFSGLIYPAYMDKGENKSLSPDLIVDKDTPTTFLFTAFDDFAYVNGSLVYASALQKAKVPYSLEIIPKGGHGFGISARNKDIEAWPGKFVKWVKEVTK